MKLNLLDWMVIGFIITNVIAHTATVYIEGKVSGVSGLAQAGQQLESNPTQRTIQNLGYIQFLVQGALFGVLAGFYYHFREKAKRSKDMKLVLTMFVFVLFILSVFDVTNDLAYVLAIG
jgi:hypothetical protein